MGVPITKQKAQKLKTAKQSIQVVNLPSGPERWKKTDPKWPVPYPASVHRRRVRVPSSVRGSQTVVACTQNSAGYIHIYVRIIDTYRNCMFGCVWCCVFFKRDFYSLNPCNPRCRRFAVLGYLILKMTPEVARLASFT